MNRAILSFVAVLFLGLSAFGQEKAASSDEKGKASTIVFFREHHVTGNALKPSVYVDGKEIERLPNGRWFSFTVEPGKHELGSSAKHEAHTVVETTAGQTVYVQMIIVTGIWRGAGRLIGVDSTEAQEKIAKLKPLHGKENE